jgi:pimeloyl-ACP methyl ester carboxylesterase
MGTLPRVLCVVLLLFAAGCTGESQAPSNGGGANLADTVPGRAPDPAQRCQKSGNTPVEKVVLTTTDGVHLAGARFGTGAKGVVLLPQRGADLCPWFDYANALVTSGYHVLAIDFRGTGYSEESSTVDYTADALAAVAALKQAGAQRVVLMGASIGAATALVAAGRDPQGVVGVISLSYPEDGVDVTGGAGAAPHTPLQAAPLLKVPVLLCFTTGDRQAAKPDALAAAATAARPELVGRPGVSHGWDMLKIGDDDVRPEIQAFLESVS